MEGDEFRLDFRLGRVPSLYNLLKRECVSLLIIVYEKCSGWAIRRECMELAFGPDGEVRNVFQDLKNATTLSFNINVIILVTVKRLGDAVA
jgi:hypothetical protein